MIGVKHEFYTQLRDDYIKNGECSFLYRYMEQEKCSALSKETQNKKEGKRSDSYMRFMQYYKELEQGVISEKDYLICVLSFLIKGDKIRLQKDIREELFAFGKCVGGEDIFLHIRRDVEKYQQLICILQQKEITVDRMLLEKIHADLLECALSIDVQTFLYDVGYPVHEQGKLNASRKKDRNLDMLSAYCNEKKISLFDMQGASQNLSEKQIAQYKQLYKVLRNSNNRDVVIPIQVDKTTGAGVYIVGKNNISKRTSVYEKIKGNCCYACFSIDGLNSEEYRGINVFSWLINDEDNTLCNLPNLEEALKWHIYFKNYHLDEIKERNGRAPKGCPEEFMYLFETEIKKQDILTIREEELAEVKALFT